MNNTPIRVVLGEDYILFREGLRKLLELESDITVVGEAEDGRKALALTEQLLPDVLIMDAALPSLNGLQTSRLIKKKLPNVKILILSSLADHYRHSEVQKAGASGYLTKQICIHDLARAIRKIVQGCPFLHPLLFGQTQPLPSQRTTEFSERQRSTNLSRRQRETLQLVAEGKANKQVADVLMISIKTVEKHRHNLMKKLGIHETAGLTRFAIAAGLVGANGI